MSVRFPDITRAQFDTALDEKASCTPSVLSDGETFLVKADEQVLYAQSIQLEGDAVIQIDGVLIEVD
jgi:hypothetical protein